MEKKEVYALCECHMHRYIGVQMKDGCVFDGIVESVDEESVHLAVPVGAWEADSLMRAFVPFVGAPFPYVYPAPYPGYFFPRRRFIRQTLPLAGLLGLSLLPYY